MFYSQINVRLSCNLDSFKFFLGSTLIQSERIIAYHWHRSLRLISSEVSNEICSADYPIKALLLYVRSSAGSQAHTHIYWNSSSITVRIYCWFTTTADPCIMIIELIYQHCRPLHHDHSVDLPPLQTLAPWS